MGTCHPMVEYSDLPAVTASSQAFPPRNQVSVSWRPGTNISDGVNPAYVVGCKFRTRPATGA